MKSATSRVMETFQRFAQHEDKTHILRVYRNLVYGWKEVKTKLNNPYNSRTKKPLSENTIRKYKQDLRSFKTMILDTKAAIRMFIEYKYIGNRPRRDHGRKVVSLLAYRAAKVEGGAA